MICGNYAMTASMSGTTRVAVESFWEYVAFALNPLLFLLIGLEVHIEQLVGSWRLILVACAISLWRQGVRSPHRAADWRFLARALVQTPRRFGRAVGLAINAEHRVRYAEEEVLPRLRASIAEARRAPRRMSPATRRLPLVTEGAALADRR